jgi:hypothetical protein
VGGEDVVVMALVVVLGEVRSFEGGGDLIETCGQLPFAREQDLTYDLRLVRAVTV